MLLQVWISAELKGPAAEYVVLQLIEARLGRLEALLEVSI